MTHTTKRLAIAFLVAVGLSMGTGLAHADDEVDAVVEGITTAEPGSEDFQRAADRAKALTDAQAAEAAQKIVEKITGDAQTAVNTLLNLYKLGLKAGQNPFLKALGKKLADALGRVLSALLNIFNDPETNSGKLFLNRALQDLGVSTDDKRQAIIEKLEAAAQRERERQQQAKNALESKAQETLTFDASTGLLSFTGDAILSIVDTLGRKDVVDAIIGADVLLPSLLFDGINPEGLPGFINPSATPMRIQKDGDVFLEAVIPGLVYDGGKLSGFGTALVLSGAPLDSFFDGGLPDVGSDFIAEMLSLMLSEPPFQFYFSIEITPDVDLLGLTGNFTHDGSTGFTNLIFPSETVPEPSALALAGLAMFILIGLSAQRRLRSHAWTVRRQARSGPAAVSPSDRRCELAS